MNSTTFGTILLSLMMAGLLVGGVAIPLIDNATTETISVENENPQWIRMAYLTDQSDYQVSYAIANDTITITNGEDTQSGAVTDTILYADDKTAVMVSDGDIIIAGEDADTIGYKQLTAPIIIDRTDGVLSVTDANDTTTFIDSRTWAYVPLSTEKYGVFSTGNLNRYGGALAVTGAYAGVYCYNDYVTEDVGLVMDADVTNDYITSVKWAVESADAKSKTISPFVPEEKIIKPIEPEMVKSVATPTYTDGDWGYDLVGGKAKIVSYSGPTGGVLTIPATVGGYDVTTVGKGTANTVVDTSSTFTGLVISQGITTIQSYAFNGCSGFTGTLTIPSSVTSIGDSSFNGCSGFTGTLTIPGTVTSIGTWTFYGCSGFTGLTLNDGITDIGFNAFSGCSGFTGTLTIPSSITSIGKAAFNNCSGFTGTLTIPSNVTSIGNSAFSGCSGFTGTLTIPGTVTSLGSSAFADCTGFTGLVLSEGMTSISSNTFSQCRGLTGTLTIPSTVTSIGTNAFYNCSGLTGTLTIPNGVTSIGNQAFISCHGFTGTLVIPGSVTSIGNSAFNGCSGITDLVVVSDAIPGNEAFTMSNCDNILDLSAVEYTTTSYGLTAETVQDHIDADSYLAITEINVTEHKEGAVYDVFLVLPVVMIAGVVLVGVYLLIRKY